MRGLISFLSTIIVISLLVCIVGWVFTTDFLIFDIILWLALLALQIIIPIVVLIIIIWVILELVNIFNC
jgi:hypothetical protein